MSTAIPAHLSALYERDETAWLDANAALIREGKLDEVDFAHLAEFLEDMAKRDRREVKSRLIALMVQRLKWHVQTEFRSRSWQLAIVLQRWELADMLESEILRQHAETILMDSYSRASLKASSETGLPRSAFPASCPYTLDGLLTVPEQADDLP